jgi:hypothetical protein
LTKLNCGKEDNFGDHAGLDDMSLSQLDEMLKLAELRILGAGQSSRLSMYDTRRFIQKGVEKRASPGSHAEVVYRPEQVIVLMGEEEDVVGGSHVEAENIGGFVRNGSDHASP